MSTKCTSGLLLLGHVEGLVAVLRGVEVVDAGRVGGEGHVGQTRLGVLLEELQEKTEKGIEKPGKWMVN